MEDIYRSQFRLPYSLYESLKEAADANRRSVNAELVARLEASFDSQNRPDPQMTFHIDKDRLLADHGKPKSASGKASEAAQDDLEDILRDIISNTIDAVLGATQKRSAKPSKGPVNLGAKYDPNLKVMTKVTRAETIKPASKRITRTRKKPAE
ncbi:Arc family DNA-binding protein [Stutzerimonas stutzeri]|uniref:Arc family DNA-binding protein n=1 Tax=Stutzerimonas stutzeri TaxID=316 RepID=UPI00244D05B9|nr:Arc family DNA-binding protein [Stutzerimonas stutzeri]MDH0157362.1 Arc family DNA-binding protein [Stutzerimonas stutzeri]